MYKMKYRSNWMGEENSLGFVLEKIEELLQRFFFFYFILIGYIWQNLEMHRILGKNIFTYLFLHFFINFFIIADF